MTEAGKVPPNSILVAIPSIGIVYSEPYESMLMAFSAGRAYWHARYPESAYAVRVVARKPADNARNILTDGALTSGFDWVWWVDDDQEMPEGALQQLHQYDVDMASGLYGTKTTPSEPLVFRHDKPPDGREAGWYLLDMGPENLKGRGWADATGFGCLLMKRKVLVDVWRETGGEPFRWTSTTTDDIHFFKAAKKLGYRVLMDMDLRVGHWGTHKYEVAK